MFSTIDQPDLIRGIFAQIKENIRSGSLKKGDALPSERELAATFGVSRNTLREAIKSLQLIGLIECVQGAGNYVSTNLSHSLSEPFSVMFMLEDGSAGDILQFRQAIEIVAARHAAVCLTDGDISTLDVLAVQMSLETEPKAISDLDTLFHLSIIEHTANPLIITMMNAAEVLVEEQIYAARVNLMSDRDALSQINAQHRKLLDTFRAHDPDGSVAAITDHLEFVKDYMLPLTDKRV
ncbi:MAG: FadR/GntR family transcriptional regulator [Oscillospiraceae bacterium]